MVAKGSLREQMPVTAAWIDEMRAAFGKESIDGQLRKAMKGEPVFFAQENGHTVGTPSPARVRVQWDQRGRAYVVGGTPDQGNETTKFEAMQLREQKLKGMK
jgi:hypothetical protein